MTQLIKPMISKLTERNDVRLYIYVDGGMSTNRFNLLKLNAAVCQATPITTTVSACVAKDVRVGLGFALIAVFTGAVTSTISAAKKGGTVPTV